MDRVTVYAEGSSTDLAMINEIIGRWSRMNAVKLCQGTELDFLRTWSENLRELIFTWNGTLRQNPSEIHHLYLPKLFDQDTDPKANRLQITAPLKEPDLYDPQLRSVGSGAERFVLRKPLLFAIKTVIFNFNLGCWHWYSGELLWQIDTRITPMGTNGRRAKDLELSPDGSHLAAALEVKHLRSTSRVELYVWALGEEGPIPVSWSRSNGLFETVNNAGFSNSSRFLAFSEDSKFIRASEYCYNVVTGEQLRVPSCCADLNVCSATWTEEGHRIACIRNQEELEIYNYDGRLISKSMERVMRETTILDFSRTGRFVLVRSTSEQHEGNEQFIFTLYDATLQKFYSLPSPLSFNEPERNGRVSNEVITSRISADEKYAAVLHGGQYSRCTFLMAWNLENRTLILVNSYPYYSAKLFNALSFDQYESGILHLACANLDGFEDIDLHQASELKTAGTKHSNATMIHFDLAGGRLEGKVVVKRFKLYKYVQCLPSNTGTAHTEQ
jgi:hypothetical protein